MTTTSAPIGLVPVFHQGGGTLRPIPVTGGLASGYGTSIFTGDPLVMTTGGVFNIAGATNSSPVDAVFQGVQYTDANGTRHLSPYWPASTVATNITVMVTRDPQIVYEIQANGSIAQTAVGDGAPIVLGSGNTRSGQSTSALSSTLAGATNPVQFKIVGLGGEINNAWGDTFTNVQVIVGIVSPAYAPGNAI